MDLLDDLDDIHGPDDDIEYPSAARTTPHGHYLPEWPGYWPGVRVEETGSRPEEPPRTQLVRYHAAYLRR